MEDLLLGQLGETVQGNVEMELNSETAHVQIHCLLTKEVIVKETHHRPDNAKSKSAQVKLVYL